MNFSLTPQLESFVRECAESGEYNNASEVVREAIAEGEEAISRSESHVFNSEEELDHFFDEL